MSREETNVQPGTDGELAFSRAGGIFALWSGLLLPPVAWFVQFQTTYALVAIACAHHSRLAIFVVTLVFLAAAAGGGLLSWSNWTKAGGRWEHQSGGPAPRSRFLAMTGVLASVLFFLVILAQGIAGVPPALYAFGNRFSRVTKRGAAAVALAMLALAGCHENQWSVGAEASGGGDPVRGKAAISRYGCGSCHTVSGVPGADGQVGPPLDGIGGRVYVAGRLTNTPDNLVRWIRHPSEVDEKTGMPDLGVSEQDARDIVGYLYSL